MGVLDLRAADGREVRAILAQPKRLALLVYLAVAPNGPFHRRDALLGLLWPDSDDAHARASLSRALHFLRSFLGEGAVISRGDEELGVNFELLSCDVVQFRSALQHDDYAAALELYRGDFLDGFFLDDVPEFERWVDATRDELREQVAGATRTLSHNAEKAGNLELALHWARRTLAFAPYDERDLRRVVTLSDQLGDSACAVEVYQRFAKRLKDELDLEPSDETRALINTITTRTSDAPAVVIPLPKVHQRRRRLRVPLAIIAVVLLTATVLRSFVRRADQTADKAASAEPAANREAYTLYLKGRYFWNKRTEGDIQRALDYYEQAVDLDPGYALAWAGIADTWIFRGWYAHLAPRETFPKAKHAALRALEFDSTLAAAHASLAHIHFEFDHDWDAAEREYQRAIQLEPGNAIAHQWYGGFLSGMGRHAQALAQADTAVTLDPLAPIIQTWLGLRYHFAGNYQNAIKEFDEAVRLADSFAPAYWHRSWAYVQEGRATDAVADAKRAATLDPGNVLYQAAVGYAYARAGSETEARAMLTRLADMSKSRYVPAYDVALIHIALGDRDVGLNWLERALAEQSVMIGYLRVDPRLDPVRGDARFRALLQKAALD